MASVRISYRIADTSASEVSAVALKTVDSACSTSESSYRFQTELTLGAETIPAPSYRLHDLQNVLPNPDVALVQYKT